MSKTNSNNLVNPNARDAMDRFKMEAANEVGVNLKQGYNGDLTSRQAGSVGGQMVKNVCPTKTMQLLRKSRTKEGYLTSVRYIVSLTSIYEIPKPVVKPTETINTPTEQSQKE